jgi:hypothetical protein
MTATAKDSVSASASGSMRHEPIFLLAPARSYSTVSLALLAGHPDLYGFPEMLIFTANTVGELLDQCGPWRHRPILAENRLSGIIRATAELHDESQESWATRNARQWLAERSSWSPVDLMDHLLRLAYPKIGLEKSPDTVATDEALDACFDHYPNSRYIHLTRHPVTTMRSAITYWRSVSDDRTGLAAFAASSWYSGHRRILRKLDQLPAGNWLRIKAEDLVTDPATWLPRLLDWLGLPHDDAIVARMTRTERWRFAGTGPSGDLLGGDGKFMRSPALRPIPEPTTTAFDPAWGLLDENVPPHDGAGEPPGLSIMISACPARGPPPAGLALSPKSNPQKEERNARVNGSTRSRVRRRDHAVLGRTDPAHAEEGQHRPPGRSL